MDPPIIGRFIINTKKSHLSDNEENNNSPKIKCVENDVNNFIHDEIQFGFNPNFDLEEVIDTTPKNKDIVFVENFNYYFNCANCYLLLSSESKFF
jgi:hypothetical protein